MKNPQKKINQILTRNHLISGLVWAIVILASANSSSQDISYILIAGFFVEFLRIASANKSIKEANKQEGMKGV